MELTPQTTLYPIKPAKEKVKTLLMNSGPVAFPSASAVPIPAVKVATSLVVFCQGVNATTCSSFAASAGLAAGAGGAIGGSGGSCIGANDHKSRVVIRSSMVERCLHGILLLNREA